MTWATGSEKSQLAIALFAICLSAASATAKEGEKEGEETQAMQGTREVAGHADSAGAVHEFRVPTTVRSGRPEGESPKFEALLRLPSGFVTTRPRAVAGAGESEWRRRFVMADRALSEARAELEDTKRELDGIASGGSSTQWSIAPPGGESSPTSSPLSFKLRQQLREGREQITVREKALRGLRIEADLAGVPQSWRTVTSNSAEPDKN